MEVAEVKKSYEFNSTVLSSSQKWSPSVLNVEHIEVGQLVLVSQTGFVKSYKKSDNNKGLSFRDTHIDISPSSLGDLVYCRIYYNHGEYLSELL